jgi:hypothetical protein
VDTAIDERLVNARDRLRAAVEHSLVPIWLTQTARRCLIDLDLALSGGLSDSQARMLLAQVDALISVAGEAGLPKRGARDADSK